MDRQHATSVFERVRAAVAAAMSLVLAVAFVPAASFVQAGQAFADPDTTVTSISYTPAKAWDIVEGTGGYWTWISWKDDDNVWHYTPHFYHYEVGFRAGDTLQVTYSDSSVKTYRAVEDASDEDNISYYFVNTVDADDVIRDGVDYDQGGSRQSDGTWAFSSWNAGDHTFSVRYGGAECTVPVHISEDISACSFNLTAPISFAENEIGELNEDAGFFEYDLWALRKRIAREGNSITVERRGDSGETLATTYRYSDDADAFVDGDGDKIDPYDDFEMWQEDAWSVGSDNNAYVGYRGKKVSIPVTITENPVESIGFDPAVPYEVIEGADGYWDDDDDGGKVFKYYPPSLNEGDKLTVTLKGESGSRVYVFNSERWGFVDGNDVISEDDVSYWAGQDWTVGSNNVMTVAYMGKEVKVPVTVVANPVASIEFTPAGEIVCYEGVDTYEDEDGVARCITPDFREGDTLTVNLVSGGTKTYRYVEGDSDAFVNAADETDVIYPDAEADDSWTVGGSDNTVTVRYMGKTTTYKVTLKSNDVESFTYTFADGRTYVQGDDFDKYRSWAWGGGSLDFHTPFANGDVVTVTKTDGTTASYTYSSEDDAFKNGDDVLEHELAVSDDTIFKGWAWPGTVVDEEGYSSIQNIRINEAGNGETTQESIKFEYMGKTYETTVNVVWEGAPLLHVDFISDTQRTRQSIRKGETLQASQIPENTPAESNGESGHTAYKWAGDFGNYAKYNGEHDASYWLEHPLADAACFHEEAVTEAHTYRDEVTTQATSTTPGVLTHTCTACGYSYTEEIPVEHAHTLEAVAAKAATCEGAGNTAHWKCTECGKLFSDEQGQTETTAEAVTLPATGHDWGEGVVTTQPTCTAEGVRTFTCSHDATHTKTESVSRIAHTPGTPARTNEVAGTCLTKGSYDLVTTCTVCGTTTATQHVETDLNPSNHAGGTELRDAHAATCTAEGYTGDTYCLSCGEKLSSGTTTPKTAHTLEAVAAKAATCEGAGNTAHWKCTECGKLFSDEQGQAETTAEAVTLPATGHDWGEWEQTRAPAVDKPGLEQRVCKNDPSHTEQRETGYAPASTGAQVDDVAVSDTLSADVTITGTDTVSVTGTEVAAGADVTIGTVEMAGKEYKVTEIAKDAFKGTQAKSVTIGASVKTIGTGAFANAKQLETVRIGGGVTSIGSSAFSGASKLKSLTLGSKVKTIGASAFAGASSLKSVKLDAAVQTIGKKAFSGAVKLSSFTVTKNVKRIGASALSGCKKLKTVTLTSKKLTSKKAVNGFLKGSSVKTVKLKSLGGKKNAVKKAVKKYGGKKGVKFK